MLSDGFSLIAQCIQLIGNNFINYFVEIIGVVFTTGFVLFIIHKAVG